MRNNLINHHSLEKKTSLDFWACKYPCKERISLGANETQEGAEGEHRANLYQAPPTGQLLSLELALHHQPFFLALTLAHLPMLESTAHHCDPPLRLACPSLSILIGLNPTRYSVSALRLTGMAEKCTVILTSLSLNSWLLPCTSPSGIFP